MKVKKKPIVLCVMLLALCMGACGRKPKENPYGALVAELGDEDTYGFLDMDYENYVMVTSDGVYDAGNESQAAIACRVYYYINGETVDLGILESDGTAYPLSFSKDGIFAGSGYRIEKYAISEKDKELYVKKGVYVEYDETGNARFTSVTDGIEAESDEGEFEKMAEEYGKSQVIHFSYGASGCINEIEY